MIRWKIKYFCAPPEIPDQRHATPLQTVGTIENRKNKNLPNAGRSCTIIKLNLGRDLWMNPVRLLYRTSPHTHTPNKLFSFQLLPRILYPACLFCLSAVFTRISTSRPSPPPRLANDWLTVPIMACRSGLKSHI